jgi:hypothetical protein
MSASLTLGLLLQTSALVLVLLVLRASAFRHAGFYFVLAAWLYHCASKVLELLGSTSKYSALAPPDAVENWAILAGVAMLAFSIAYLVSLRPLDRTAISTGMTPESKHEILNVLDWRLLSLACLPLAAITAHGGYDTSIQTQRAGYAASGLTGQFLVLGTSLAAVSFVSSGRKRRLAVAVPIQLATLALVGQRLEVITGLAMTLVGLSYFGLRLGKREIILAGGLLLLLTTSINAARGQLSRQELSQATSVTERLSGIRVGAIALATGRVAPYAQDQQPLAERLDGNSFPAAVLARLEAGDSTVGLQAARVALLDAVPSFLAPAKLNTSLEQRSEKALYVSRYGYISPGNDFLPTQLGTLLPYYGPTGLLVLAGLLGAAYGLAERALRTPVTPSRIVLAMGLLSCAFNYERTLDTYAVTLRGAVLVALLLFGIRWIQKSVRRGHISGGIRAASARGRQRSATQDMQLSAFASAPDRTVDIAGVAKN